MKALHWMDRYRKEVLQVSTWKHGINVQYLYDMFKKIQNLINGQCIKAVTNSFDSWNWMEDSTRIILNIVPCGRIISNSIQKFCSFIAEEEQGKRIAIRAFVGHVVFLPNIGSAQGENKTCYSQFQDYETGLFSSIQDLR